MFKDPQVQTAMEFVSIYCVEENGNLRCCIEDPALRELEKNIGFDLTAAVQIINEKNNIKRFSRGYYYFNHVLGRGNFVEGTFSNLMDALGEKMLLDTVENRQLWGQYLMQDVLLGSSRVFTPLLKFFEKKLAEK
jgi:hypothetical protein